MLSELILPIVSNNDLKSYRDFMMLQQENSSFCTKVISYATRSQTENESLTQLIASYFRSEHVTELSNLRNCDVCQEKRSFERKNYLTKPPKNLVIILQRYGESQDIMVNYPLEIDLSMHLESGSPIVKYHLYAIITHSGLDNFGHYKCFCRNHTNKNWYCFNDTKIREVSKDTALNNRAYMLLYGVSDSA